jgi:FkbM family methyltransferase
MLKDVYNTIRFIVNHPITNQHKLKSVFNYFKWQLLIRLVELDFVYKFVDSTYLILSKGLKGATGNLYVGLHEFEFMGFTLHFIREDDLFCDIGANIGTYTLLASGVCDAKSISIEPIKKTFNRLNKNILFNELSDKVELINIGLGSEKGKINFTNNTDTMNRVATISDNIEITECVEVNTLNNVCYSRKPNLIKLDVEGYELNVLKGSNSVLSSSELMAIIIELNENNDSFGYSSKEIDSYLNEYGFYRYRYDPLLRKLEEEVELSDIAGNRIYLKVNKIDNIVTRLQTARKFTIKDVII